MCKVLDAVDESMFAAEISFARQNVAVVTQHQGKC